MENHNTEIMMNEEKNHMGFRTTDLMGIAIMIIPFIISIVYKDYKGPEKFLFFTTKQGEIINIRPNMVTSIFAVLFYAALITRYNIFRAATMTEGLISSVRAFMNCWVLSSLISLAIPSKILDNNSNLFSLFRQGNKEAFFFTFAVLLSWLGMKTIAGYSWIIFIFVAMGHVNDVNNSMGMLGALYIITIAISLFLQISNYSDIRDFVNDFRVSVPKQY